MRFNTTSPVAVAAHNSIPLTATIQLGKEHGYLYNTYWIVPSVILSGKNGDGHIDPFMLVDFPQNTTTLV